MVYTVLCVCLCVHVVETRWGQGSLALVCKPTTGFIMHKHHTLHEAVLAPGPGLLAQAPALVHDPSPILGVLLPGLNSILVSRLLSIRCRLGG